MYVVERSFTLLGKIIGCILIAGLCLAPFFGTIGTGIFISTLTEKWDDVGQATAVILSMVLHLVLSCSLFSYIIPF